MHSEMRYLSAVPACCRRRRTVLPAMFLLICFFKSVLVYHTGILELDRALADQEDVMKDTSPASMVNMNTYTGFSDSTELDQSSTNTLEGKDVPSQEKPYLVFHVGPPKTATTSLQTSLTEMNDTLFLDNYVYAGRYYRPVFNTKLSKVVPNRKDSDLGQLARSMFKPNICPQAQGDRNATLATCVQHFKRGLDAFRGRNVILSDEAFSKAFHRPELYSALRDAVSDDWQVIIVVGYRHFFRWLPSDMFQRYRMDKTKGKTNWKNHWPTKDGPGEKVTLLFPFYYKKWIEFGHIFTDSVLENVGSTFPVRIMHLENLGEQQSLRSAFLCDVLPNAPHSCSYSMQLDRQNDRKGYTNSAREALHVNYDMLTTGAAELGLIDLDRFNRTDIRHSLRNFTEFQLKLTPWDFDLTCPKDHELEEFLNMSLVLEAKVFGVERADAMKKNTRIDFHSDVEKSLFCEVNTSATVSEDPWKTFFAHYSKQRVGE